MVASLGWCSWLGMMLVHEGGHVIGAAITGGTVQRVVWHPAVISRTDVYPSPSPTVVLWAGPVVGVVVPACLAALALMLRMRLAYLVAFFAGFCLIANGAYIGIGAFHPLGDAEEVRRMGFSPWTLGAFGVACTGSGFWIWDRISRRLGFGRSPHPVPASHACIMLAVAVAMTLFGLLVGNRT
jgi:hypothetical protein